MPPTKRTSQTRPAPRHAPARAGTPHEVVNPRWLVRALALTLVAALVCVYLAACLLVYQGAWQLVLHPKRTVSRTPASAGLAFTPVRFADFGTGTSHLTGWWIPAAATTPPGSLSTLKDASKVTILYLHDGSGSLSDTIPALTLLHRLNLNVFAIDYRGFGASDPAKHPDADRMEQDAAAALDHLVSTRHIPVNDIIPYGSGLGAPLAVQLAHNHPELPAVIVDNPDPDPAASAAAAGPSHLIPVRLLFGDRFAIAKPLANLSSPKLLIARPQPSLSTIMVATQQQLFQRAASPSYSVTLPSTSSDAALQDALRRFLDEYIPNP